MTRYEVDEDAHVISIIEDDPEPACYIWVILRDGVVQGSYRERPNDEICKRWVDEGMVVERWTRPTGPPWRASWG